MRALRSPDASSRTGLEKMERLLRLLSGKDAFATPLPGDKGARAIAYNRARQQITFLIPSPRWKEVVEKSWVAPCKTPPKWQLSMAGRTQLRRLMSGGERPVETVGTRPDLPNRSHPSRARSTALRPAQDPAESPVAWLRRRRSKEGEPLISQVQFDAAERLRADFWFAEMTPRVTTNWSAALTGGASAKGSRSIDIELRDAVVAARERVRLALAAVGPDLAGLLIDVCCHLKGLEAIEKDLGWPRRSGKLLLGYALNMLARHYGMAKASQEKQSASRIYHWGARGYRPPADAAEEVLAGRGA